MCPARQEMHKLIIFAIQCKKSKFFRLNVIGVQLWASPPLHMWPCYSTAHIPSLFLSCKFSICGGDQNRRTVLGCLFQLQFFVPYVFGIDPWKWLNFHKIRPFLQDFLERVGMVSHINRLYEAQSQKALVFSLFSGIRNRRHCIHSSRIWLGVQYRPFWHFGGFISLNILLIGIEGRVLGERISQQLESLN